MLDPRCDVVLVVAQPPAKRETYRPTSLTAEVVERLHGESGDDGDFLDGENLAHVPILSNVREQT